MKKQEKSELLSKDIPELRKKLNQLREDIAKLKVERKLKKNKNVSQISEMKKDVARLLTIIRSKEMNKS